MIRMRREIDSDFSIQKDSPFEISDVLNESRERGR